MSLGMAITALEHDVSVCILLQHAVLYYAAPAFLCVSHLPDLLGRICFHA